MVIMQGRFIPTGPTPKAARSRWAACFAPMLALGLSLATPSWTAEAKATPAAQSGKKGQVMQFRLARAKLDKALPDSVARKIPAEDAEKRIVVINQLARMLSHYPQASRLLENEQIAAFFANRPVKAFNIIATIIRHASEGTSDPKKKAERVKQALDVLLDEKVTPVFVKYPDIFADMAAGAKGDAWYSFEVAEDKIESTVVDGVSLYDNAAIEVGRPLDDLRGNEAERTRYFNGLSSQEKLGLLCSDPSFFDASSNALLFRWLKLESGGLDIQRLKDKYRLNETQVTNLAFRILNNGLVDDFVSSKNRDHDASVFLATLIGTPPAKNGIYADAFNPRYFYLLANGAEKMAARFPSVADIMKRRIAKPGAGSEDSAKIHYALSYAQYLITKKSADYELQRFGAERAVFNPKNYVVDGKVTVLQVFDREDTGNSHWHMSNAWFGDKYGKSRTGRRGELIFEDKSTRVVHFIGETKADNQRFVRSWVAEHKATMIALRADEIHLQENMPYDVFGDTAGRYLFINGVCFGAEKESGYLSANPDTTLDIMSYSSTGRGQVTNTLVELLLATDKPAPYKEIIDAGRDKIAAKGGDAFAIKTPTAGQGLLSYVNMKTARATSRF